MEYRKCSHHRTILALLNETILYPKFEITWTVECGPSARFVKGSRSNKVKLYVGRNSIIQFQVGSGTREPVLVVCILGCEVELPVSVFHRLGVVGPERRTCKECRYADKYTEKQPNDCCKKSPGGHSLLTCGP